MYRCEQVSRSLYHRPMFCFPLSQLTLTPAFIDNLLSKSSVRKNEKSANWRKLFALLKNRDLLFALSLFVSTLSLFATNKTNGF